MSNDDVLESVITCPSCGTMKREVMPTDACQWFYECTGCKSLLKPKRGDCCVFCSYGTVKCPPVQAEARCCSGQYVAQGQGPARKAGAS